MLFLPVRNRIAVNPSLVAWSCLLWHGLLTMPLFRPKVSNAILVRHLALSSPRRTLLTHLRLKLCFSRDHDLYLGGSCESPNVEFWTHASSKLCRGTRGKQETFGRENGVVGRPRQNGFSCHCAEGFQAGGSDAA